MITPHKFVAHRSLRARGLRTAFLLAQRRLSFRAPARFEAVEVRRLQLGRPCSFKLFRPTTLKIGTAEHKPLIRHGPFLLTARRDISVVLTRAPALRPALVAAFRSASPQSKLFAERAVAEIDPRAIAAVF